MRARLAWAVAVVAGFLAVVALAPASAGALPVRPAALSQSAAYPGDFPDPYVLPVGGTYWAYSTGSGRRNLQVMSSANLAAWSPVSDPLPSLPAWAQRGNTWAPAVISLGGRYVMYYTVRDAAYGRQCISTAVSATPGGPFSDASTGPLVCQLGHGGSIDSNPFVTSTGALYLLWKSDDNAIGQPTELWSQPLAAGGLAVGGRPSLLLTESRAWQSPAIEGPTMVASQGVDYLFYGAGNWNSAGAAIGYATCRSPAGPCTNASVLGPWVGTHGAAVGPSGPATFTTTAGGLEMAYHAWTGGVGYQNGGVRSLWIDTLSFRQGRPVLG